MARISPPLPFCGHKGMWNAELASIARALDRADLVVDVFGGSGMCSRIMKSANPALQVIFNDFDGYGTRLLHAPETEKLRDFMVRNIGATQKTKTKMCKPLSDDEKNFLLKCCDEWQTRHGFLDYDTLATYFILGVHKMRVMQKFTGTQKFYNRLRKTPIDLQACNGWLVGIESACARFNGMETVFETPMRAESLAAPCPNRTRLLVVDPPYVGTSVDGYAERENLRVLKGMIEVLKHEEHFVLFGDASVAFWYEIALGERFRFCAHKTMCSNFGGHFRTETIFSTLPFDGGEPFVPNPAYA